MCSISCRLFGLSTSPLRFSSCSRVFQVRSPKDVWLLDCAMSDSEEEIAEKQFKICLIGDSQVGKTSIVTRYATETFKQFTSTVGVEFYLKRTVLPGPRHVTLKVWDIGGDAMKGRMLDKYVFGANAVMLIYDVTNYNTFENLEQWLRASQKVTNSMDKPPTYALVANKIDQEHLRTVKSDRHHKFAQENGLLTYAVSAKTSEGVNLCFQKIAAELVGIRLTKAEQEQQQTVVKADIVTYPQNRLPNNPQTSVKTAVCSLQ